MGYPIAELCNFAEVSRSSYYKWTHRSESESYRTNAMILEGMIGIYTDVHGIYGYRRMTMNINRIMSKKYNHKRITRLMKSVNMKSVIRRKKKNYIPSTPQITAENVLNRQFQTDKPNQKWLTDVTEFKLTNGQKAYLSAILDLWGIIKSEMYYLQRFHTYDELKKAIDDYIVFYNMRRIQKNLKGLTPIEYRNQTLAVA